MEKLGQLLKVLYCKYLNAFLSNLIAIKLFILNNSLEFTGKLQFTRFILLAIIDQMKFFILDYLLESIDKL